MSREIRIATRKSALALWQAEYVKARLEQAHPGLKVSLVPMVSRGDKLLDEPLKALEDEFGERFVRIHRNALVARERIERLQRTPLGHFQLYLKGLGPDALTVSRRHVAGVRKLMHSL